MPLLYWWGVVSAIGCLVGSIMEFFKMVSTQKGGYAVLAFLFAIGNTYVLWYLLTGVPR